jgi:hypothetical protein
MMDNGMVMNREAEVTKDESAVTGLAVVRGAAFSIKTSSKETSFIGNNRAAAGYYMTSKVK